MKISIAHLACGLLFLPAPYGMALSGTGSTHYLTGLAQSGVSSSQSASGSTLVAQPVPDRTVYFDLNAEGKQFSILWGLDTAWPSEDNIRRGVAFMGASNIDVVRVSFQPTHELVAGELQSEQIRWINTRIGLVNLTNPTAQLVINSDHPSVHAWYAGNAARWAQLMDLTTRRYQQAGRKVVTISPFNEPDYTATGQGSLTDFYNIAGELRKNPLFDSIRISGGNTLNTDQALNWYNQLKSRLDEGNTHQLAGSFDNYAAFFRAVRGNGHHASNDELHNVMEAMVGAEYGMQTGIWWGTAEYARSEFVKASDGVRLGYAEHRPNWTAASVYRHPGGKVQAFVGSSERQAVTTTYRFVSAHRSVFYDGHGPQREFTVVMPGGTGYQQGQTNAEKVVNITQGDDIQPVINGSYVLVNRQSKKVMEVASGSSQNGANIRQGSYGGFTYQQWNVVPVDAPVGGDFSYFTITAKNSGKSPDIYNWSLQNGGNIALWEDTKGGNQQWYLEYAGDGWFYIRSRHSAKCIEVANGSVLDNANIQQWDRDEGLNQQWRFVPVGTVPEFEVPEAPSGIRAEARTHSIGLSWQASSSADVVGYTIFRSTAEEGDYETIARGVAATSFVDNDLTPGIRYFYKVSAIDASLNRSAFTSVVSSEATGGKALVARYGFESSVRDTTEHLNHGAVYGSVSYTDGATGGKAIVLGSGSFVQLPYTIANHRTLTISARVNFRGLNSSWQRIFDFGNDPQNYLFLTPRTNSGRLRFAIRNGGAEQTLDAPTALPYFQWSHVAVTMGADSVKLYVNGTRVAATAAITIRPSDFRPAFNYIGRSQFATDPMFTGYVDDFRVYSYELSPDAIGGLYSVVSSVETPVPNKLNIYPNPAVDVVFVEAQGRKVSQVMLYDLNGRLMRVVPGDSESRISVPVAGLAPGVYVLKILSDTKPEYIKVLINSAVFGL